MMFVLDVDRVKHGLGRWEDDPTASGMHARRLCLALAREHLHAGYDIVIGQYLARTEFIEQLEHLAAESGAQFLEMILDLDAETLAKRLAARAVTPTRPEHVTNNRLIDPRDAERLVRSLTWLRDARPNAIWLDSRGPLSATLDAVRATLA